MPSCLISEMILSSVAASVFGLSVAVNGRKHPVVEINRIVPANAIKYFVFIAVGLKFNNDHQAFRVEITLQESSCREKLVVCMSALIGRKNHPAGKQIIRSISEGSIPGIS